MWHKAMNTNTPPLKITTIGDGMVGKTCLLVTYTKNEFPKEYVQTIYDNHTCNLGIDGKEYEVTLWDTAGQEDFDRVRSLSYPNTDCFIICYSIANRTSFNNVVSKWAPEIRRYSLITPILLVGTKSDLRNSKSEKFVTLKEAKKLKHKVKAAALIECSAKKRQNVDEVFQEAVRAAVKKPNVRQCPCTII